MKHLSTIILLSLWLFAASCKDDDELDCRYYFLTQASNDHFSDVLYYHDNASLAVVLQSAEGAIPRRDEFTYDANNRLDRVDHIGHSTYSVYYYDDQGRIELIQKYDSNNGHLILDMKYLYDTNGKLTRREFITTKLTDYELYEYPADNTVKATSFKILDDDTEEEGRTLIFTLDNNPAPYPAEYYLDQEAWGSIPLPLHNILSYQTLNNGEVDDSQSGTRSYAYNPDGYPISGSEDGVVVVNYKYACDGVKEK